MTTNKINHILLYIFTATLVIPFASARIFPSILEDALSSWFTGLPAEWVMKFILFWLVFAIIYGVIMHSKNSVLKGDGKTKGIPIVIALAIAAITVLAIPGSTLTGVFMLYGGILTLILYFAPFAYILYALFKNRKEGGTLIHLGILLAAGLMLSISYTPMITDLFSMFNASSEFTYETVLDLVRLVLLIIVFYELYLTISTFIKGSKSTEPIEKNKQIIQQENPQKDIEEPIRDKVLENNIKNDKKIVEDFDNKIRDDFKKVLNDENVEDKVSENNKKEFKNIKENIKTIADSTHVTDIKDFKKKSKATLKAISGIDKSVSKLHKNIKKFIELSDHKLIKFNEILVMLKNKQDILNKEIKSVHDEIQILNSKNLSGISNNKVLIESHNTKLKDLKERFDVLNEYKAIIDKSLDKVDNNSEIARFDKLLSSNYSLIVLEKDLKKEFDKDIINNLKNMRNFLHGLDTTTLDKQKFEEYKKNIEELANKIQDLETLSLLVNEKIEYINKISIKNKKLHNDLARFSILT